MATKRKDGWYVVQMALRADEYHHHFEIIRDESGLTESSFMRSKIGLEPLTEKMKKVGQRGAIKRTQRRA
jgi:hypothetical protein